jgi:putative ATPase
MSELDLFEPDEEVGGGDPNGLSGSGEHEDVDAGAPLAARMRPRSLEEFRGQEHLLGSGKAVRAMLDNGQPSSMILWGPPGSGKTTLARLIARETGVTFVPVSAVTDGIARVRAIVGEASQRLRATGGRTILFCDEIHRFNKAQQDAFLPHVESGTVILVGATTENPSFEVIRPLLSRAPVFVLDGLSPEDLLAILLEALASRDRGLGRLGLAADEEALTFMADSSDGDARRALGVLEAAAGLVGEGGRIGIEVAREALQHRFAAYDKGGEEHYNLVSALHKAVRGSDPNGALYWLARMIDGGEDPLYIARRLVRIATEDIGLADPDALSVSVAARDAFHFLGSPEGELALAEAVLYLATAPKSNRVYEAWSSALARARETPGESVPMHVRNAPTSLMKDLGYGKGYQYDHAEEGGVSGQTYLPERLEGEQFYHPGQYGHEKTVSARLEWWNARRREAQERDAEREGEDGG